VAGSPTKEIFGLLVVGDDRLVRKEGEEVLPGLVVKLDSAYCFIPVRESNKSVTKVGFNSPLKPASLAAATEICSKDGEELDTMLMASPFRVLVCFTTLMKASARSAMCTQDQRWPLKESI